MFNQDQVTGMLRAILPAVLAYAVGKGWIPGEMIGDITAIILAIAAAVWSYLNNRTTTKAAAVMSEAPGTKIIVPPGAPDALRAMSLDPGMPNITPSR